MYPSAAAKILKAAPQEGYKSAGELLNAPGLTSAEKDVIKKYEGNFVFLPPRPEYVIDRLNNVRAPGGTPLRAAGLPGVVSHRGLVPPPPLRRVSTAKLTAHGEQPLRLSSQPSLAWGVHDHSRCCGRPLTSRGSGHLRCQWREARLRLGCTPGCPHLGLVLRNVRPQS